MLPFECQEKKRLVRSSVIFPVVLEAKLFQFYSTFRPRISTLCLPIQCSLLWLRGQGEPPACSRDMDLESGPHQCQGTHLSFDEAPFSSVPGQARRICALGQLHAIPVCPSLPLPGSTRASRQVGPVLPSPSWWPVFQDSFPDNFVSGSLDRKRGSLVL